MSLASVVNVARRYEVAWLRSVCWVERPFIWRLNAQRKLQISRMRRVPCACPACQFPQASASIRHVQDQWDADVRMERTEGIDLEDSPRAVVEEDVTGLQHVAGLVSVSSHAAACIA